MIIRLIVTVLMVCMVLSLSTVAQQAPNDPGVADTVALILNVNNDTTKATLEVYVYSDEQLTGATIGMNWYNPDFQMDSAKATTAISDAFNLITVFYESDSLQLTNENRRMLVGGVRGQSAGLAAEGTGRRLWTTYYFSISGWGGYADDGVTFDTLTWDGGSDYLFVSQSDSSAPQTTFRPLWSGALVWGNPPSGISVRTPTLPKKYLLGQNYPNPFNPTTQIAFDVPQKSWVTLEVFNVLGQFVATVIDKEMSAGSYVADWDGTGTTGAVVSSGVYLYRLRAGDFEQSRKMVLLK